MLVSMISNKRSQDRPNTDPLGTASMDLPNYCMQNYLLFLSERLPFFTKIFPQIFKHCNERILRALIFSVASLIFWQIPIFIICKFRRNEIFLKF